MDKLTQASHPTPHNRTLWQIGPPLTLREPTYTLKALEDEAEIAALRARVLALELALMRSPPQGAA